MRRIYDTPREYILTINQHLLHPWILLVERLLTLISSSYHLKIFGPLYKLWRLEGLSYSFLSIHHTCFWRDTYSRRVWSSNRYTIPCIYLHPYKFSVFSSMFSSCSVILILCIINQHVRYVYVLRDWQLATYVSLSTIPPPDGSRGPKGLIQTLSLLL